MPFTVDQLTSENQKLVTVTREDTIQLAMERMIEHDYGQLPVVDGNNKLQGMVTAESILKAMMNFGSTVSGLKVAHAMESAKKHFAEDDLFESLDDLRDASAVVIVDRNTNAMGIVTGFDTMEYFRRRAQDMMYLEDIESALKDYIKSAFTNSQYDLDEGSLANAVREATQSDTEARKVFKKSSTPLS